MKYVFRAAFAALLLSSPALAERFPPIPTDQLTPEQKAVVDAITSGPRKSIAGPFNVWLRSPALADPLQKVGAYVRFQSSLPVKLNEFAILITGRQWTADFEWAYHYPLAVAAGLKKSVLADLSDGKTPVGMDADETLVYDFSTELHRDKTVSDATYNATLARFGERGVTDLIAVNGYYDIVCMTLNVAQVGRPENTDAPPLPRLRQ
jgi:4-carboxymuconolactone decarboxylase